MKQLLLALALLFGVFAPNAFAQTPTIDDILVECPDWDEAEACPGQAELYLEVRTPPSAANDEQIIDLVVTLAELIQERQPPMPVCLDTAEGIRVLATGASTAAVRQQIEDIADALCEYTETAALGDGGGGDDDGNGNGGNDLNCPPGTIQVGQQCVDIPDPPLTCEEPQVPNEAGTECIDPPLVCEEPQVPNEAGTECIDPPLVCEEPQVPNEAGTDCVDPPLVCEEPQVPNEAGTDCVDPPLVCEEPQVPNEAGTACIDPPEPPSCEGDQTLNEAGTECELICEDGKVPNGNHTRCVPDDTQSDYIPTQEELDNCAAAGGEWNYHSDKCDTSNKDAKEACELAGKTWVPSTKQCVVGDPIEAARLKCLAEEGTWNPLNKKCTPKVEVSEEEAACIAEGGEWNPNSKKCKLPKVRSMGFAPASGEEEMSLPPVEMLTAPEDESNSFDDDQAAPQDDEETDTSSESEKSAPAEMKDEDKDDSNSDDGESSDDPSAE